MLRNNKKIVVIGGGTGVFTVLTSLKPYFENLTAIVTMADDGGSTGILREEFGILPPGDIRRALVALSAPENKMLADLFSYRFEEGSGLTGHNFGNLLITAMHRLTGNFEEAVQEAGKILRVKGRVVPVTLGHAQLAAELENSQIIKGETNIDIPQHDGRLKINRVWLSPEVSINPNAGKAILESDLVIIGPGDLYTSIIPNLLVKGVKEALQKTKAKKIYFVNLMTKFGETAGFSASDFIKVLNFYLGEGILDYAILNNKKPGLKRLASYIQERAEFVEPDLENIRTNKNFTPLETARPKGPSGASALARSLTGFMPIAADLVRQRGLIRHDPEKLAGIVKMIL